MGYPLKFLTTLTLIILLLIFHFIHQDKIQVFVVPHSHIDPGWLKTVEEYQGTVYQILSNVIRSLQNGEHRKFIWAETIYFKKWYEIQDEETQKTVKFLIASNRLEMVGGGWIQNDEALPTYTAIIDQMTLGHKYLLERFGVRPTIAWQIDPFGHGGVTPQLFAEMGFDALVINRVHHRIKTMMKNDQALEFVWKFGNTSCDDNSCQLFTHTLHTHYAAVQGFDFEDRGIPAIDETNKQMRADLFVENIRKRANAYRTSFIMVPFGDDFKFQQAGHQFSNMDRLMNFINTSPQYDMILRYATLSDYFYAMHSNFKHVKFPVIRQHDFFPYADNDDSYWTGYYSSLPTLKKRVREEEARLKSAEISHAFGRLYDKNRRAMAVNWMKLSNFLISGRENVAVVNHHDAITGTCRSHVAGDYLRKLDNGGILKMVQQEMLTVLLDGNAPEQLKEISGVILEAPKDYVLVVHNPESHRRLRTLHIRSKSQVVTVLGPKGNPIEVQVIPTLENDLYDIFFLLETPGFSIQQVTLKTMADFTAKPDIARQNVIHVNLGQLTPRLNTIKKITIDSNSPLYISNGAYRIQFDNQTGYINTIEELKSKQVHKFPMLFTEYQTTRSGSYIFRPQAPPQKIKDFLQYLFISNGNLLSQVIVHTERVILTVRLFHHPELQDFIESIVYLRAIPSNTEMMMNFGINAGGQKGDVYSFDGLKFAKRVIMASAPVGGRFYPSISGALYRFTDKALTVWTDHSMGFTASSNELSFMIHRRLSTDDGRGMSQPNSDQSEFRFKSLFQLKSFSSSEPHGVNMIKIHQKSHSLNNPVVAFVADSSSFTAKLPEFSPLAAEFDERLQILTFQSVDYCSNEVLLRVQNLSPTKMMFFRPNDLFNEKLIVTEVTEKSLSMMYDIPPGWTIHHARTLQFQSGQPVLFDFTSHVDKSSSDSQNTEEEGVFLSSAALEEKSTTATTTPTFSSSNSLPRKPSEPDNAPSASHPYDPNENENNDEAVLTEIRKHLPINKPHHRMHPSAHRPPPHLRDPNFRRNTDEIEENKHLQFDQRTLMSTTATTVTTAAETAIGANIPGLSSSGGSDFSGFYLQPGGIGTYLLSIHVEGNDEGIAIGGSSVPSKNYNNPKNTQSPHERPPPTHSFPPPQTLTRPTPPSPPSVQRPGNQLPPFPPKPEVIFSSETPSVDAGMPPGSILGTTAPTKMPTLSVGGHHGLVFVIAISISLLCLFCCYLFCRNRLKYILRCFGVRNKGSEMKDLKTV